MELIEKFVRRYARRTTRNGDVVITTNGDALFQAAFTHLGWPDPYPDPELLPKPAVRAYVTATVSAPERAVMPRPKDR
jgi:hypothetical protein